MSGNAPTRPQAGIINLFNLKDFFFILIYSLSLIINFKFNVNTIIHTDNKNDRKYLLPAYVCVQNLILIYIKKPKRPIKQPFW
ncbi:Uncharacterised protein [Mycoplasmopsis caviae]|uniref:Uncharacterized protein n=1 Tax=Mycoplasmopsis caviae TaxID=55603 RepID=A0A3P8KLR2_9BACT|nr:Uncharacterised protein [Mycoplasmopsis caviae]